MMVSSPTALAVCCRVCGLTENPKSLTAWAADCTVSPSTTGLVFMAKYTPGSRVVAAIMAITATKDSMSIAP
jgi:lambda repressor-like predicted transcriptional regulator